MNVVRFLVFTGLSILPALVGGMELSGTVLGVDRKPIAGVQVRLVGKNAVATTDSVGEWRIQAWSTRIGLRDVRGRETPSAKVVVENGRLQVRIAGRDIAGRGGVVQIHPAGENRMAGRTMGVPDTLTFALGGKVLLRDTVSVSRAGIVHILDSSFNPAIVYGYLSDIRDGRTYRTVQIGKQVWMAENLSYRKGGGADSGWRHVDGAGNNAMYGRLYAWSSLMNLDDSCDVKACASKVQEKHRGICPQGWHVPSDAEWDTLTIAVGGSATQGTKLKSSGGWYDNGNGTDDHGFNARPGGYFYDGSFRDVGLEGNWWSATENDARDARNRHMYYQNSVVISMPEGKLLGFAARCVQGAARVQPGVAMGGMKLIPAGIFAMGSPKTEESRYEDEIQHSVNLSAFWMDSASVTQDQYEAMMGVNPSSYTNCGATCPVEQVSWFDAALYCNARSKRDGLDTVYIYTAISGEIGTGVSGLTGIKTDLGSNGYRLPTEAQWEYAARGGTTTAYYWGNNASADTVSKYAWYSVNSDATPHPVATKPANPFGLYDMAGNVWNWANDWYDAYATTEQTDPEGPSSGTYRVLRNGGNGADALGLRTSVRHFGNPDARNIFVGFRTVRPLH